MLRLVNEPLCHSVGNIIIKKWLYSSCLLYTIHASCNCSSDASSKLSDARCPERIGSHSSSTDQKSPSKWKKQYLSETTGRWPISLSVPETRNYSRTFYCVSITSVGSADWLNRVKAGEYWIWLPFLRLRTDGRFILVTGLGLLIRTSFYT